MTDLTGSTPTTMMQHHRGFTLIELMFVLVILSILLLVAVPNYDSVVNESKIDKARYNIASALAFARTEAVKQGQSIRVECGNSSACSTSGSWSGEGWRILDSSDSVLRVDDAENSGVTISYECGDTIEYSSLGSLVSTVTGSECEFEFADSKAVASSNYLCISATGRVRMSDNACE